MKGVRETIRRMPGWSLLALGLGLLGQPALWWVAADQGLRLRHPDPLAAALAIVVAAPLLGARRMPLAAFAVSACALVTYDGLSYSPTAVDLAPLLLVGLVMARTRSLRIAWTLAAAFEVGLGSVALARAAGPGPGGMLGALLMVPLALLAGLAVRSHLTRTELARREELLRLEESRVTAERASWNARLGVAQQLHDAVGHAITLSVLHAEVAARLIQEQPDKARATLVDLGDRGRLALTDLQVLLEVILGNQSLGTPRPPGGVNLVDLYEGVGLAVHLQVAPQMVPLPADVDTACSRVVAEALSNAVRHGGATSAEIRLSVDEAGLLVEVEDDGAGPHAGWRPGFGLRQLTEYVRAIGGSLYLLHGLEGGGLVRAVLPLTRESG